jgi:hypothetical protein
MARDGVICRMVGGPACGQEARIAGPLPALFVQYAPDKAAAGPIGLYPLYVRGAYTPTEGSSGVYEPWDQCAGHPEWASGELYEWVPAVIAKP